MSERPLDCQGCCERALKRPRGLRNLFEQCGSKMADTEKRIVSHAHADVVPGTVYLTPEGTVFSDLG